MKAYWKRRRQGVGYALKGMRVMVATQEHARIHLLAATVVLGLGFWLSVSALEWCVLVLAIMGVWVAEAVNTAIEFTVDLCSPGFHPLAGKAKDVAAGAVLSAAVLALLVGGIVFVPRLLDRLAIFLG